MSGIIFEKLKLLIEKSKICVDKTPVWDYVDSAHTTSKILVTKYLLKVINNFFYANVINNFKNNYTQHNMKETQISEEETKIVNKEFNKLFKKAKRSYINPIKENGITSSDYKAFKTRLAKISKGSHKLLLELEKFIEFQKCEEEIQNFLDYAKKSPGKKLKMERFFKDGEIGISIGFESNEEYNENSKIGEYSNEITDFDNISISFDDEWVTLEDDKGHFFGEYHISNNKKYLVAYCDAHGEVDKQSHESIISGQVYLIQDQKKILWKKKIDRPNDAFVNNDGICVVIDWLAFEKKLSGKLHFFDRNGKKLTEYHFNSNIGGQEISRNGDEVIITTCFPENAIYLFSIKEQKLIKKVENNTSKRPLVEFRFDEIKRYILKTEPFNQVEYDLQKQKEKQEIEENKERIDSLKKKRITDLSYDELVEVGSVYAGDFYGNFGEPQKALNYLLRAIELKREKPQPYVLKLIGFCYEKMKDFKTAIKYYEESLNRYPQYKKSVVVDHIEFCNLKLRKKFNEDWTSFIIKKREKEMYVK